jgi:hypothetical protein
MEGAMIAIVIFFISISLVCMAGPTNQVAKVEKEKEKKLEHTANKIVMKERDKGSKKETDWKPSKEFPLMFGNNRLGRKPKDKQK